MQTVSQNELDRLVHLSRRQLWVALLLILVLGGHALVGLAFPDSAAALMAQRLGMVLPVIIIVMVGGLRVWAQGVSTNPSSAAMKALRNDELRQVSLRKAYANGFAAMLVLQPGLAPLLAALDTANPVAVMAGSTSLLGAVVFLASLLYYDR
ncbi:MAG: hypothetical protein ACJ8LG_08590 [Massilia sp.]